MMVVMGRIVRVSAVQQSPAHKGASSAVVPQAQQRHGTSSAPTRPDIDDIDIDIDIDADTPRGAGQGTKADITSTLGNNQPWNVRLPFPRWHSAVLVVLAVIMAVAVSHLRPALSARATARLAASSPQPQPLTPEAYNAVQVVEILTMQDQELKQREPLPEPVASIPPSPSEENTTTLPTQSPPTTDQDQDLPPLSDVMIQGPMILPPTPTLPLENPQVSCTATALPRLIVLLASIVFLLGAIL
ncbi:hypothetical protein SeMB42_g04765 [Synchytrium endobioticum]|nr:hypothetical protein SeMB42_g04765 [Synchytrium endobioticum]